MEQMKNELEVMDTVKILERLAEYSGAFAAITGNAEKAEGGAN